MKTSKLLMLVGIVMGSGSLAHATCSEGQQTTTYNNVAIQTAYGIVQLPMGTAVTVSNLQHDGPAAYFHADVSGSIPAHAQANHGPNGSIVSCGIVPPQTFSGTLMNLNTAVYPFTCDLH